MDITMLPPSTILSNHSHHLYHAFTLPLLPSILPRHSDHTSSTSCGVPSGFQASRYRTPRHYEPAPPITGSPMSDLPDDLLLEIFKSLTWGQLLPLQRVSSRFSQLARSASLQHTLSFTKLPPFPLPTTLLDILPHVKHLHLHLFPYPSPTSKIPTRTIMAILDQIKPDQLISLSLPFSAPYLDSDELDKVLRRVGGRLQNLDLRGSAVSGQGRLEGVGRHGSGLKALDIGFTNITELPSLSASQPMLGDSQESDTPLDPFRNLTSLTLSSCTFLSPSSIYTFLHNLPTTLQSLDISRLEQVSFAALKNMRVVDSEGRATALTEIKVVGIDHLTRLDIRRLKYNWEDQRFCQPMTTAREVRVWGEPHTNENTSLWNVTPIPIPTTSTPRLVHSALGSSSESSISSVGCGFQDLTISTPRFVSPDATTSRPSSYESLSSPSFGTSDYKIKHPFLADVSNDYSINPAGTNTNTCHDGTTCADMDEARKDSRSSSRINIVHSAILESEDEAGYRQFIGEVAGGTVGLGFGLGHGGGFGW